MPIRILIVDDHAVVRKGVRMLLEDEADLAIVGEATDGDEALAMLPELKPDMLLLDITMPRVSGLDVARTVSKQHPAIRTLIFSMHHNPDYILSAVQSGAYGYLLKDTSQEEMLRAVRTVAAGDLYYPPSASAVIIRHLVPKAVSRPEASAAEVGVSGSLWRKLTPRESQILTCLTEGLSSRQIADRFAISPNTVANQRASIIRKAGVRNTVELIRMALKEKKRES